MVGIRKKSTVQALLNRRNTVLDTRRKSMGAILAMTKQPTILEQLQRQTQYYFDTNQNDAINNSTNDQHSDNQHSDNQHSDKYYQENSFELKDEDEQVKNDNDTIEELSKRISKNIIETSLSESKKTDFNLLDTKL